MAVTLRSRLPEIARRLDDVAQEAVRQRAELIAAEARSRVPVNTGRLRNAIHVEQQDDMIRIVGGDGDAWYGHLVEFGTKRHGPRPFLLPAYEAHKPKLREAARRAIGRLAS